MERKYNYDLYFAEYKDGGGPVSKLCIFVEDVKRDLLKRYSANLIDEKHIYEDFELFKILPSRDKVFKILWPSDKTAILSVEEKE